MSEDELERKSLSDLERIIREARKHGIKLVLIGGYAVAAYTKGYRFTKDIDLIADKPAIGRLKGLLRTLGYSIRDTGFGLAGSKKLNKGFIDLHIGIGKISDISTGTEYPFDSELFRKAKSLKVKGYYSKDFSLKVPIVDLETLFVLKLMPIRRQKDAVDVLSLILNKKAQIDFVLLADRAKAAGVRAHMLNQVRDYARRLNEGELEKVWFSMTASRLPYAEKKEIGKFFSKLANVLRQP